MKLLSWFDTTRSNAFAKEIAEEFARNYPLKPPFRTQSESQGRLKGATEILGNRAAKLNREHPLGWYRRARFANTVKLCLQEHGYDVKFVDGLVYNLVLRMSR